ncbi:hypothetical protein PENSUB_4318 [Penicillium subrubescens]|uniref:Uncharacterized protein n=1 Tax=Penicillium subrubescens TaxID=1316194 RepID=A0A1Q5UCS0_9EURO|nr:hypothetical protein PENSUB_4318 [Penicillium subrubescens]
MRKTWPDIDVAKQKRAAVKLRLLRHLLQISLTSEVDQITPQTDWTETQDYSRPIETEVSSLQVTNKQLRLFQPRPQPHASKMKSSYNILTRVHRFMPPLYPTYPPLQKVDCALTRDRPLACYIARVTQLPRK